MAYLLIRFGIETFSRIPHLIFESVSFLLVAYRTYTHHKDSNLTESPVSLLSIIFRDSLIYFFVSLCIAITNAMVFRYGLPGIYNIAQGPSMAVFSIALSRMLMNLRKAGREDWDAAENLIFSGIKFRTDADSGAY